MRREPPVIRHEEETRDLGFGSVVSRESRQRLLNRDGSFNVKRKGLSFWASLSVYHMLLTISWTKFLALITVFYFTINAVFALAYMLCGPDALQGSMGGTSALSFQRAFFFSVQTFSTIGYGNVSPISFAANMLVTIESLIGLLAVALATGLVFARFSRPTAHIVFSRAAIIAPYRGITAFEFRIANTHSNQIIELEAKVLFSRFEETGAGSIRRYHQLHLERDRVTFFPLSWTIVHPIDETSPLYGLTPEDLMDTDAEFLILLTGIDETFSQTVHARSSYKASELIWNAKFGNVFNPTASNEPVTINVEKIHHIESVDAAITS